MPRGLPFALGLLVILSMTGFAGAHRLRAPQPTLTFYFWGDATEYETNVIATQQVAAQLNVHIRNIHMSGDYETGLLARINAQNGPDIFYVPDWWLPGLAARGILLNLDSYVARDPSFQRRNYVPQALAGLTFHGHLYGLPRGFSPTVLYFNKDIFDQMHVAYPTTAWTLNDVLRAARTLTTRSHLGLLLHGGPGAGDKPNFFYFLWSFGADYIDRAGTRCTLTDRRAQQAFRWVLDLTYTYHVQPTSAQIAANGGWSGALFARGKVGMVLGTQRWFYLYTPLIGGGAPKLRWGAQVPPLALDGTHRYSYPGYAGLGIWAGSRNRDLAYQVGKAISQSAGQTAIARAGIDLPAYEPVLHSRAPFIAPDPRADAAALAALAYTRIPHYVVTMKDVQAALDRDLARLWLNRDTVTHATQTACHDLAPLLAP
ncbi:MAG: hypothetical protein NVSMB65_03430 [Chloroflexota bacterium]